MSYNDELMRYQDDAEDRYDDYQGMDGGYDEEDDFETGIDGLEDGYDDEYIDEYEDDGYVDEYDEDMYDDYSRTSIQTIDPNDRTLTVVVKNDSDENATAVIFGGNRDIAQPQGVTVDVEESSHKEVKEESKSNPFKIVGMKLSVSNALQFDNVLKMVHRTASGSNTTRVWQPRNSASPQNFSQNMIDSEAFSFNVSGQSAINFTINAKTTAVFTFTIKARANMGNLLEGRNIAELSRTPRTTGLPQIDLKRSKRPTALGLRPRRRGRRPIPVSGRRRRKRPTSRLRRR